MKVHLHLHLLLVMYLHLQLALVLKWAGNIVGVLIVVALLTTIPPVISLRGNVMSFKFNERKNLTTYVLLCYLSTGRCVHYKKNT